ncbi:MAG: glycogen phosphorylase, partial [Xanthomonadales bacterium]|nr:glycogen phosphorylase [Xanthomonadales bacterium]
EEVVRRRSDGYRPGEIYRQNEELRSVIDLLNSGVLSHGDADLFRPITDQLVEHDPYLLFADYPAYLDAQSRVDRCYRDYDQWTRKSILNAARIGKFSSDRSIRDYCRDIWHVEPLPVRLKK